jgi:hypothetical protein
VRVNFHIAINSFLIWFHFVKGDGAKHKQFSKYHFCGIFCFMLFRPHENEINFDPDVRLPQMEAERSVSGSTRPPIDHTKKGMHDRSLSKAERALRLRNIEIGSTAILFAGSVISERVLELNLISNSTIGSVATGLAVAVAGSEISRQNQKVKSNQVTAVKWAAYEVIEAEHEGRDAPNWALYSLQEADTTADDVLPLRNTHPGKR